MHNIYTGAIKFNKGFDEQLILESEIASLAFFGESNNFWFIGTCWEGRVAFFSQP